MANLPHITRCGLAGIDRVPFGLHACHFYSHRDQLVAALAPYFVAGLRAKERCLWVTAPPLLARKADQALCAVCDDIDDAIQTGALRILDAARLKGLDGVELCLEEEERALAEGYNGLRVAGNANFLTPGDWPAFIKYEQAMTARFDGRRIVALCSYALTQCDDRQKSELIHAHHCALEHPDPDQSLTVIPRFPRVGRGEDYVHAQSAKVRLNKESRSLQNHTVFDDIEE